jgi:hypothetical protein
MEYNLSSICGECKAFNKNWGLCSQKDIDLIIKNYLSSKNKIRCQKCKEWVNFKLIVNKKNDKGIWMEDRILDRYEKIEKTQKQEINDLVNSL